MVLTGGGGKAAISITRSQSQTCLQLKSQRSIQPLLYPQATYIYKLSVSRSKNEKMLWQSTLNS
jgi:hypothetical protein